MKVRHIYSIFHLFALLIDGLEPDTLFFSNQNSTILAYRNAYSDIFMFELLFCGQKSLKGALMPPPLPYHRFFFYLHGATVR